MTARSVAADVARHEQWITSHEKTHAKDDARIAESLERIDGKIDRLLWWLLGLCASFAASLTVGVIVAILRMVGH